MIDVFDIITSIEAAKRQKNIVPSYALFTEISIEVMNRVKRELNQCVIDGKLDWSETINSIGFSTKNKQ